MNASSARFLGIDLGTGSVKLAIVDGDGVERVASSATYAFASPQPGWAEIAAEQWWDALCDAAAGLPADERAAVRAIGLSGQMHGVVLTDAAGRALRPALLWPDTRALALLDAWPEPQPNPVAPGMAGPLLRWVMQHEPEVAAAACHALQPKDWLRVALGGAICADPSDACATALATPEGGWDRVRIARLGLPSTWFGPLVASSDAAGALSAHAAHALGLPAGIPIAAGAGDTPCAMFGSGLANDGDALLTTGTGGQIVVTSRCEPAAVRGLHRYRSATGHWYTMAAMQNVGVALEAARGWLSYEWADAYRDAFAATPSATLAFLPYLSGERSPWLDPAARGGWLGASLGDTRATLMRAAFEGVAFALRAGLDAIRASGVDVTALKLAGGGSVEPRWRQLLADALDVELHALDCPNAAARGAALLGGLACGHWRADDLAALAPASSRVASPSHDAALARRYARFIDLYGRVRSWFAAG
ncbi:MAG TPA: FGGY family carbohydrate kinase [Paraburkholderia sp.]